MKGFGIYVKNDLLEAKHIESMGTAVWLYMWFLDKMTSIGEDGIGKVLGGKPVIFEEVQQALGITERTYRRWIATLKKSGYINITRTPRGLSVSVNKAAKIFGKRSDAPKTAHQRSAENGTSDRPKTAHRLAKNGTSNKDNTVDNTVRLSPYGERRQAAKVQSLEIDRVIKAFELMDYTLPSPTKQRRYTTNLIKREGVETVLTLLRLYCRHRGNQFCPTITSPEQLYYKWDEFKQWLTKEKIKQVAPKRRVLKT